ncbi:hypothetical protein [Mucilaginibacter sp.]|uniref:hypothetical protein n=1 Tax=Mucilaginibacter sp. TaxID=1882438 RepID=UPI0032671205
MKRYLFFSALSILISVNSFGQGATVWTNEYEQRWYDQLDKDFRPRLPDSISRKEFLNYTIKRLKKELPQGIESVKLDSVIRLSRKIGKEYAYLHSDKPNIGIIPAPQPWTKDVESLIREAFLKDVKKEELAEYNKLCDCVIEKLKQLNPTTITFPLPKDVVYKIAGECYNEIGRQKM